MEIPVVGIGTIPDPLPQFDPKSLEDSIKALEGKIAGIEIRVAKIETPITVIDTQKPFKKDSWMYRKLGPVSSLTAESLAIVADLVLQSKIPTVGGTSTYYPALPFEQWSVPIYHVKTDIPKKNLTYSKNNGKTTLFRVPDGVVSALGTDRHCAVFDWIEKRHADLYNYDPATLVASHGGIIENFQDSDGTFLYPWGSRACGIGVTVGVITLESLAKGVHEGVVAFSVAKTNTSPKWPANRVDSYATNNTPVRMGQIFRLPATFVPDPLWPKVLQIITVAFRDYGGVVVDTTHGSCLNMAYIEDPRPQGKTAAEMKTLYYGGLADWQLGQKFPWAKLQAIEINP